MPQIVQIEMPKWYAIAEERALKIDAYKADPFGEEMAIRIRAGDRDKEAVVPARAVNQERRTVTAWLVGEVEDGFLLSLPPSSLGMTTLRLSKENLDELTEEEE